MAISWQAADRNMEAGKEVGMMRQARETRHFVRTTAFSLSREVPRVSVVVVTLSFNLQTSNMPWKALWLVIQKDTQTNPKAGYDYLRMNRKLAT